MSDPTYSYEMDAPISEPPRRVLSLVPSVTESLVDLGLGERLVGITDACIYPPNLELPRVGPPQAPNLDAVTALTPDLVIVNPEVNQDGALTAIDSTGLTMWVTFPRSVSDALNLLWNIMHVFDNPTMVPRVRLIEQTLDWILGVSRAKEDQALRMFVPLSLDPMMTCNADTYPHDLLRVCGAQNVFAEAETRYPVIELDDVEAAQPDVILLPDNVFQDTDTQIPLFTQLDVPAAAQDRVFLVDGTLLTWPGTRLAYALDKLPALLEA